MSRRGAQQSGAADKEETVQGLERGLQVLEALSETSSASLQDLHLATGISKPSLLRLLNTLGRAGYVTRRVGDGRYRISAFSHFRRKPDRHDRVVEGGGPVLDRLCRRACHVGRFYLSSAPNQPTAGHAHSTT